jgi:hypothetical protein
MRTIKPLLVEYVDIFLKECKRSRAYRYDIQGNNAYTASNMVNSIRLQTNLGWLHEKREPLRPHGKN